MGRNKDDEYVTEPMLVTRRKNSRYSNSRTRPGEFSPLTRDEHDELGQVTLRRMKTEKASATSRLGPEVEPVWDHDWSPQRTQEQEEWDEFVQTVVQGLIAIAIERGKPHVRRLWREKIQPSIQASAHRIADGRRRRRHERRQPDGAQIDEPLRRPSTRVDEVEPATPADQAQARILAALLAGQLTDDQLRRVAEAAARDEGLDDLVRALSQIPPAKVALAIENLQQTDGLLTGDALTGLGIVLGMERDHSAASPRRERRDV